MRNRRDREKKRYGFLLFGSSRRGYLWGRSEEGRRRALSTKSRKKKILRIKEGNKW